MSHTQITLSTLVFLSNYLLITPKWDSLRSVGMSVTNIHAYSHTSLTSHLLNDPSPSGPAFREAVSGLAPELKARLQAVLRASAAETSAAPIGMRGAGGTAVALIPPPLAVAAAKPRAPAIQLKSMFALPKI